MPVVVATVAVAAPLAKPLSYRIPEELRERARIGVRLRVPLGRRRVVGFLLSLAEAEEAPELKPVAEVLDDAPLFSEKLVSFFERAAAYYHHPIGEVIRTALPAGLGGERPPAIVHERILIAAGRSDEPSGALQRAILSLVRSRGRISLAALREQFPSPHAAVRRLAELGFLEVEESERRRDPFLDQPVAMEESPEPTAEQRQALEAIAAARQDGGFAPFLLHGVTGSGKTEVYLQAIADVINAGRQALILVPEIALTPQLVGRFRSRFCAGGVGLAVLHSALSDGERYDAWRAIARGEVQIAIGARSAVFAPLPDLGIVVVDEEHEGSYKQQEGWRYHARDLALLRAQMAGAVVLLGSATPALTTYHRAQSGVTGYLPMTGRVLQRPLPAVELIDLREATPESGSVLSPPLAAALGESLERGEQSLLLLNRRGFAPYLLCADCGHTFRCPNCEITLTFHQRQRLLRCHYCDHSVPPPESCPECGGSQLLPEGAGTERLEEELGERFPQARVARMDRDTTGHKGAHQALIERMTQGEVDILIGTQMIAKGHDFPAVTLVGVIGADSTLNFPDFRSAERTFALLTQVAGRAGRGERPGRVLIQTYAPEHYALQCAAAHDYGAFYAEEAACRQELGYPPFGFLVNLVLSSLDPARVEKAAAALADSLQAAAPEVEVLGPAPCPLSRLRGKSRFQILLKAPQRLPLQRLLGRLDALRRTIPAAVALAVDVDPIDML